jgi:hypothetical protein
MKNQRLFIPVAAIAAFIVIDSRIAGAQVDRGAEHEAIAYSKSTPTDPIARLQKQIDAGSVKLAFDERWGYLPALLQALKIPLSSQGLVFSKTSLQVDRIGPWAPRAVYFNEDVYVGGVQDGPILEIASVDPNLGTVFFSLAQDPATPPRFAREGATCLMCHDSTSNTGGVPGLIVRSVIPDRHGYAFGSVHEGPTTDNTPVELRWGGWYVTGSTAGKSHMGNVMSPSLTQEVGNVRQYLATTPVKAAPAIASLAKLFDTEAYLSGHSDAVALMVLAHQAHVHNLITIANYETRKALYEESGGGSRASGEAQQESTRRRIRAAVEPLVRALVFADEAVLDQPGDDSFAGRRTPRDRRNSEGNEAGFETVIGVIGV